MLKLFFSLTLVLFSFRAEAADQLEPQAVLAIAKIAGSCGILDEMLTFQKKTRMKGGEAFVERFWETEAARRGVTVKQMSDDCDHAINSYNTLWKSMEKQ